MLNSGLQSGIMKSLPHDVCGDACSSVSSPQSSLESSFEAVIQHEQFGQSSTDPSHTSPPHSTDRGMKLLHMLCCRLKFILCIHSYLL